MKSIFSAVKLTVLCLVFFSVLYPLAVTGIAYWAPQQGKGEQIKREGRLLGFKRVGQSFQEDRYFWGRPSAVQYNAAGSGGSNKGPTNPAYLAEVQARIDSFQAHHPYLSTSQIPAEMVTASGSGLDPHISPQSALVQLQRVAAARGIPEPQLRALIEAHTQAPFLAWLGPSCVHVLELNLALDELAAK